MKLTIASGIFALVFCLAAGVEGGEFRIGAHGNYIHPKDSAFDEQFGYGGALKYKFTDTLGFEVGCDYFRWSVDELSEMPYGQASGPVYFNETDRVFPIYFTALIFSPNLEEDARAYLGLGGGYYEVDADIGGNYTVTIGDTSYPMTIDGEVKGQWSVHAAVGADFMLSEHIFLNVEARYVFVDLDREQTHSTTVPTPTGIQSVTVKDEADFNNWQVRLGLEYSF